MRFKPLAVVPVFDHILQLDTVLERLKSLHLDTIVINDGNGRSLTHKLQSKGHKVYDMGDNQGLGAAIQMGLQIAADNSYSGIVCVDADDAYNEVAIASVISSARNDPTKPVLTSRFGHIGETYIPESKIAANAFASMLFETATGNRLVDVASGLRYYPTSLAKQSWLYKRFDFVYEVLNHILETGIKYELIRTFVTYPQIGPWLTKANELADFVNYCCSLLKDGNSILPLLEPTRDAKNVMEGISITLTLKSVRFQLDAVPTHKSYLITQDPIPSSKFYYVDLPDREKLSLGIIADGGRRWAKKNKIGLRESYIKSFKSINDFLYSHRSQLDCTAVYCLSLYNLSRPENELSALFEALKIFTQSLFSNDCTPVFYGDIFKLPHQFQSFAFNVNLKSSSKIESLPMVILCTAFSVSWQREILQPDAKPWEFGLSPRLHQRIISTRLALLLRSGGARTLSDFLPDASSYAILSFKKELFNDLDLESWWESSMIKLKRVWYGT